MGIEFDDARSIVRVAAEGEDAKQGLAGLALEARPLAQRKRGHQLRILHRDVARESTRPARALARVAGSPPPPPPPLRSKTGRAGQEEWLRRFKPTRAPTNDWQRGREARRRGAQAPSFWRSKEGEERRPIMESALLLCFARAARESDGGGSPPLQPKQRRRAQQT